MHTFRIINGLVSVWMCLGIIGYFPKMDSIIFDSCGLIKGILLISIFRISWVAIASFSTYLLICALMQIN